MCGRYTFFEEIPSAELEKIIGSVQKSNPQFLAKSTEINPGDRAPVYFYKDNAIHIKLMLWGFLNPWKKGIIINARSETAAEKKLFSPSLHSRRCVIPAAGFYQWNREKVKYRYTLSGSPVYMGGLYAYHEDGPRFLVLTVPANQSVSPVHSRMPLLLQKEHIRLWLRDLPAALELLGTSQPMLQAEPMEQESAQLCFSSV